MRRFFDIDGPFVEGLTRFSDIFILNILLIVCSLPVITFGAAVTGLYYVTLKMVKNEECYTVKSFFRSFKQNLKQSVAIWLILLFVGTVIYYDFKILTGGYSDIINISENISKVMFIILMMVGFMYTFTLMYVFPVLARFDNTVKNTLKNSLIMSIRHFPQTILMLLITAVPIVIMYIEPKTLAFGFIVFGLTAYLKSKMFVKIFANYMPAEQITADEDFEISINK